MNKLSILPETESVSIHGGTGAAGEDSLARDVGQYVGGFYGSMVAHPFLTNLPFAGSFFRNWYAFQAAMQ